MVMSRKIRQRLNKLVKEQGLTVSDLARKSGVDRPTCSRVLSGAQDVMTETLEKLAAALGCTVEILTK